jgi:hypothetical protein
LAEKSGCDGITGWGKKPGNLSRSIVSIDFYRLVFLFQAHEYGNVSYFMRDRSDSEQGWNMDCVFLTSYLRGMFAASRRCGGL